MRPTQDFSFSLWFLGEAMQCTEPHCNECMQCTEVICQQHDLQKPSWCTDSFKEFFTDAKKNVILHVSPLTQDTSSFLCQQCALLQISVWSVQLAVSIRVICNSHPDSWCTPVTTAPFDTRVLQYCFSSPFQSTWM